MKPSKLIQFMLTIPAATGKLIGVQFDIEPHTLPNWPQDASKPVSSTTNATLDLLCNELMDLYDIFRDKTTQNGLQFQAAIAIQYQSVFFNRNGSFVRFAETIQQVTDKVALMAYRNVAKSIFDLAIDEVLYAATIKKKVVIPIEVLNVLPPFISFYGSTNDYLQTQVSSLHQMMIGYEGYDGTSMHHYTPFRERNANGMTMAYGKERGLYVWDPQQWLNQTEFNQLVELCFMGDINTVYLHVGRYVTFENGQWNRLRTVISLFEQIGVDTMFLYGDNTWTTNHDLPLLLMDSTIAFFKAMYGTATTTSTATKLTTTTTTFITSRPLTSTTTTTTVRPITTTATIRPSTTVTVPVTTANNMTRLSTTANPTTRASTTTTSTIFRTTTIFSTAVSNTQLGATSISNTTTTSATRPNTNHNHHPQPDR
ncbi:hypothetical protein BC833DRAFT_239207 [Globomyces pollinis-pini]|nr:hypothetical protein BC833DRAFT_239207 [Globomyces pollinis-pini]